MTMTDPDPSTPPFGSERMSLAQYTGYLLRRAYARSIDCEREWMPHEVGLREMAVMATLHQRGPTSQRDLGERLHVNRSVMVKVVDTLEGRGFVARDRNTDDRRSYALRLTDPGLSALEDARADLRRLDNNLTAGLDEAERRALTGHLRTLLGDVPVTEVEVVGHATAFLLAHAHRTLRERAVEGFESLGIEPRDFGILAVLEAEQPCSRVQVATRIGVTPPAVQGAIDALVQRGLVRWATKAGDRRVHDLELTEKGVECLRSARHAAALIQADVTRLLGSQAESEMRGLLLKLIA